MAKYETVDLAQEQNALIITSTYGDGDPPDNAQAFWNFLQGESAPALAHLNYSVLALGDTNYSAFCQFGKNCDERLEKLGAKRVHPRVDCDVDYETPAKSWRDGVFAALCSSPEAARDSAACSTSEASVAGHAAETSTRLVEEESLPGAPAREPSAQPRRLGQGSAAL